MSRTPLMQSPSLRTGLTREMHIEALEKRVVMSGHSIADFTLDTAIELIDNTVDPGIDQSLMNAHDQSGVTVAKNTYGFTGLGQTVAVIDSGIAYDHSSLGGGYGEGYRVVGGWDFAENDDNPYDDGYMGSHGTHVAGIVGSDHGVHTGVAPGVDIVGLRVFDDQGAGYFSWVEDALQWVHDNRNAFDNPITTVNISLGAEWNADSIPNWAMLEDEFAQLEQDGIFIAVAAGNSFTNYHEAGLSYPAVSEYVVPVSSVDDNGDLSYFSQRHDRVIAAPGQGITSTVPDYVGNFNGKTDDFASFSGTSMASPYVAGSSVLLRQAYEFNGQTDVTQDQIYDLMKSTADSVWDAETNQYYSRLNVAAALDAIMPEDDFGSTLATAHDLGNLADADPAALAGIVNRLDDADYFQFTAAASGSVQFDVSSADGSTDWSLPIEIASANIDENGLLSFDVVAGQSYTVGLEGNGSLAHYDLTYELEAGIVDLGTIEFLQIADQDVSDESWYVVQASRDGLLTIEAMFENTDGNVDLTLYDSDDNVVASSSTSTDGERVDVTASAGETFRLRVTGSNSDVDLRLTNLVTQSGSGVSIAGTAADDVFTLHGGESHTLTINGTAYTFAGDSASTFRFDGQAGNDTAIITGTSGDETATLRPGEAEFTGEHLTVQINNTENIRVHGGGGYDEAHFHDSDGNDLLYAHSDRAWLKGSGFYNYQSGFDKTFAYASNGYDKAYLYGTDGNDTFVAHADHGWLEGDSFYSYQSGFDRTNAYAYEGLDTAYFYDSDGNDTLYAYHNRARIKGNGYINYQSGFDKTFAYASKGYDKAYFYDSDGNDLLYAHAERAWLKGSGFYNYQSGFDKTFAYASNGYDKAYLYGTDGNDTFVAHADHGWLEGDSFYSYQSGFDRTNAYAYGGLDTAYFYDSDGNDTLYAYHDRARIKGLGYVNYQSGFDKTFAYASKGYDKAYFYDSDGNDLLYAHAERAWLKGSGFYNYQSGFDKTFAYASNGYDKAYLYGTDGNDTFVAHADHGWLEGDSFYSYQSGFDRTNAYAYGGLDTAYFYDSDGNDTLYDYGDKVRIKGNGYINYQSGFDRTFAYASKGYDKAYFYDSDGKDLLYDDSDTIRRTTPSTLIQAESYDDLLAISSEKEINTLDKTFLLLGEQ